MDQALRLVFGNHPNTSEYKDIAEEIINYLRREKQIEKKVLMDRVGLNPSSDADEQKFNNIMRYLKGSAKQNILEVGLVNNFQHSGKSYYALDKTGFRKTFNNLRANVIYLLENEPDEDVVTLKEKLKEKDDRIETLEDRLEGIEDRQML